MPFSSDEVELFLQISREAGGTAGFRDRVDSITDAFSVLVPHTSFAAYVLDMRGAQGPTNGHLVFRNRDPAALAEYAQHYISLDPMAVTFPEGQGRPYLLSDFVRGKAFGKDVFTADFMPSLGIRHIMAFSHWMPDGKMFALAIHREKGLRDFTAHEREAMRLASPDIGRAIRQILLTERVEELARERAEQPRSGAMVFDAQGEVVHADPGALVLARQLGEAQGFPPEQFLPDVRRLLACEPGAPHQAERAHTLPSGDVLRIRYSLMGAGRQRSVIAILEVLGPGSDDHFEALATRYRLTAREKDVARLAAQGHGNRQIGAALGISAVTVGIHLGHVYRKTGTQGRHDLSALVNGGPGARVPADAE